MLASIASNVRAARHPVGGGSRRNARDGWHRRPGVRIPPAAHPDRTPPRAAFVPAAKVP